MPCRAVIPNGDIILIPLEANLGVVVLSEKLILSLLENIPRLYVIRNGSFGDWYVGDDLR